MRELSVAPKTAAAMHPEEKGELLALEGRLLLRAGQRAEGTTALRASLDARPSTLALVPLLEVLDAQGAHADALPLCQKVRRAISAEMAESQSRSQPTAAKTESSAPAARAASTTLQVVSECSRTVRVFYGRKPKYGSGTESTVSGHSRSSAHREPDGSFTT